MVLLTPFLFLSEAFVLGLPLTTNITILIKPGLPPLGVKPCYLLISGKLLTTLLIKPGDRKELRFTCPNPETHFVIEVERNIGKYTLGDFCLPSQPLVLGS